MGDKRESERKETVCVCGIMRGRERERKPGSGWCCVIDVSPSYLVCFLHFDLLAIYGA